MTKKIEKIKNKKRKNKNKYKTSIRLKHIKKKKKSEVKLHESKALKREERVPVEKNAGEGKRENQRQVRIAWSSSSSMTSIINCRDFGRVLRKNRFLCFFFFGFGFCFC